MKTALLAAALTLAPAAALADGHDRTRTGVLHVTASASVDVEPDVASVSAGVVSQADTAKAAMAQNSELMRKVYSTLQSAGINSRDIATSSLNLRPEYNYNEGRSQPRIQGYAASNQITVTTTDLDNVGVMIDALLDAGLNNIQNVNFTVRDQDAAMAKARRMAVDKARAKATDMASAAGVSLGKLLVFTEGSSPGAFMDEIVVTGARVGGAAMMAPPLSPGQRELMATVTLSYAID